MERKRQILQFFCGAATITRNMMNDFAEIETQYGKDPQLKREDVAKLEEWQRLQPHLPKPLHPIETALYLHSCYYNNEAAKKRIDTHYTYRTHCPEIFGKCDPLKREVRLTLDTVLCVTLPSLTSDGFLVYYSRLLTDNRNSYQFYMTPQIHDMVAHLSIKQRGCLRGHIGIFDCYGISMKHFMKADLLILKKATHYMLYGQPIRVKSLHFVNATQVFYKIFAIMRTFLTKEVVNMMHVHCGDNATIFNFVPKDMLPIECGGSSFCAIDYFQNVTRKDIEKHSEYFKLMENQLVDESKRSGKPKYISELFGAEGTFKKLDID